MIIIINNLDLYYYKLVYIIKYFNFYINQLIITYLNNLNENFLFTSK